ncbi:MAG: aminotransferase class V-fold PLP-dependent enzyme [Candidatus Latescibacterota bacterium]
MNLNKGKLFDDALLTQIRDRFACVEADPVSGKRIYLENAGGSLTLKRVVELVAEQTALPDNAGRANPTSREVERLIAQGAEDLKTLLGASSGCVALGESTTSNAFKTLGAIIRHVPGQNVVTTNLDHPAIYDATQMLSKECGKEWRVAGGGLVPENRRRRTGDRAESDRLRYPRACHDPQLQQHRDEE